MLDADIILGFVSDTTGTITITDCHSSNNVPPVADTTNNILSFNGQQVSGVTTLKFVRLLNTGDSQDKPINNTEIDVIIAYNPTTDDTTVYHGRPNRLQLQLNFFSNALITSPQWYQPTHAILMTISWGFCMLTGMLLARFFKWWGGWFKLHIAVNTIGMACSIAAFIIAILMVTKNFTQTDPFALVHAYIGLFVVTFGAIGQPILGYLADRLFDPHRDAVPIWPDKIHWWVGRLVMVAGVVNIFLGIEVLGIGKLYYCLFAAWLVILGIIFIVFQARGVKGHGDTPKDYQMNDFK